ncbi:SPRY domain-containing SOCS box protein 2 [Chanos chanos]|uniref:SPRY domain-containing SOCS box protein 2 n=1 Tax=Chanos chanos TaxID=29144 RepID=A0A6J2VHR2_CHACN|nr:SPRY domain-containing SOCS box protein 2-like [Chanos chanos]
MLMLECAVPAAEVARQCERDFIEQDNRPDDILTVLLGLHCDWMGLTLCRWLFKSHSVKRNTPSPPSSCSPSLYQAIAVTPSLRLAVLLDSPSVPLSDPRSQWSPFHMSPNMHVCDSGSGVCRTRVEQSSDAARGAVGVKSGLHVWEILWEPGQRGTHALIGVSTKHCPLQMSGYTALVGADAQTWGWELSSNQLWHSGWQVGQYPVGDETWQGPLKVPERVLVVVDVDAGMLGYAVNSSFLGVAFRGLPRGEELYPAVSCVWGGARVRLRYLSGMGRDPPSLLSLCRLSVRQTMGTDRQTQTDRLPLPRALQHHLLAKY